MICPYRDQARFCRRGKNSWNSTEPPLCLPLIWREFRLDIVNFPPPVIWRRQVPIKLSGQEVYRRRIQRALARGLSRSAARGHAKVGEPTASGAALKSDDRLAEGFARVASGESLTATASALRISRERLRRTVGARGEYVRAGKRYAFRPSVENDFPLYSDGRSMRVRVDDDNATRLGAFMAAVGNFLANGKDLSLLAPFVGEGITNVRGRHHPFETDPEVLYELRAQGRPEFHQIYRTTN